MNILTLICLLSAAYVVIQSLRGNNKTSLDDITGKQPALMTFIAFIPVFNTMLAVADIVVTVNNLIRKN